MNEITRNRVMLMDNHPMWIEVLGKDPTEEDFEIVAVVKNGTEYLQRTCATRFDVVVMDLQIPAPDGAICIELLVQESPDIQVLVMSASGEREDVLRAMKPGARGHLVELASKVELIEGVRRTVARDAVFIPGLAGLVLGEFRWTVNTAHSHDDDGPVLTVREVEVLWQMVKGLAYREIAEELFASHCIAQNCTQNALCKLRFHDRVELTLYAIDQGLHDPNE